MPKMSVIVPVYNGESYIEDLIVSLQQQTLSDIELIFVDDGSKDKSAEIIKKYVQKDERIKYFYQENQGAGVARNLGIENATSDYVICIDADDIYENNMCKELYNKAFKTNADITICKYNMLNMQTGRISKNKGLDIDDLSNKEVFSSEDISNIMQITNPGPCNKLYKKEFIVKNHLKYSSTKIINDLKFGMIALCLAEKITTVDKALSTYRYQIQGSVSKNREQKLETSLNVYKEIYKELSDRGIWTKNVNTCIYQIIDSLRYEISFPIPDKTIESIRKFFDEKPLSDYSSKEIAKLFNTKRIRKNFAEYFLLNLFTFGLNKTIKEKYTSYKNRIMNLKKLGVI